MMHVLRLSIPSVPLRSVLYILIHDVVERRCQNRTVATALLVRWKLETTRGEVFTGVMWAFCWDTRRRCYCAAAAAAAAAGSDWQSGRGLYSCRSSPTRRPSDGRVCTP